MSGIPDLLAVAKITGEASANDVSNAAFISSVRAIGKVVLLWLLRVGSLCGVTGEG